MKTTTDCNYIVKVFNGGETWFLRSTVWTSDMSRASRFATAEDARKALDAAKKFMKARIYKAAAVVYVPAEGVL